MIEKKVICAANRWKDTIVCGARHFDSVMHSQIKAMEYISCPEHSLQWEQGFIDQFGNFLTREEAWVVAVNAKQIIRFVGSQTHYDLCRNDIKLFSENLY